MKSHFPIYYLALSLTTSLFLYATASHANLSQTPDIQMVESSQSTLTNADLIVLNHRP